VPSPATVIELDLQAWVEALPALAAATPPVRVYPFSGVPQNPAWPFVTYHRVSGSRLRHTRGVGGTNRVTVQFDVFAKTYRAAVLLAAAVREGLDGLSSDALNGRLVQWCAAEDVGEGDVEDGGHAVPPQFGDEVTQFRETVPVRIWYREA
jgi:hypothetical protein